MKPNQIVGYTIEGDIITFNVKGQTLLTLDVTKVHPDNQRRAMFGGLAQVRVVDMAAVDRADKDGNLLHEDVRTRMKWERMKRCIEHLESGAPVWRIGGKEKVDVADHTLTVRAIAQVKGLDIAATNGLVDIWAQQNNVTRGILLDTFAARDDIAALVAGYRRESVKDIDTDSLLSGLTSQ